MGLYPNEPGVTESGYERAFGSEGARAEQEAPARACHQATDQVGLERVRDVRSVQGADGHGLWALEIDFGFLARPRSDEVVYDERKAFGVRGDLEDHGA